MRRVCLTIGVSKAEGLAPLRAAATAAEEIGLWAERSGFSDPADVVVLTDRTEPVTIARIAETLERLLPMGRKTDTLLLHFAGHGLREDNTRTLWLPTDWRTQLRAIAVERLKNRLSDFGIANITIISDACKALANDKDTSDLTPDGVLGAGTSAGARPIFDRFDAVHDIEAAFMIPGSTPETSRCLFSGAVVEALWGAKNAIDRHLPGKVTPGSLADYLSVRIAELCETYRLSCTPQSLPGRPEDHLIYFDASLVDAAAIPAAVAWPVPIGRVLEPPEATEPLAEEKGAFGDDTDEFTDIKVSILGPEFGLSNPAIGRIEREARLLPDAAKRQLNRWARAMAAIPTEGPDAPSPAVLAWLQSKARGDVERSVVEENKSKRRISTAAAFASDQPLPPSNANILLNGGIAQAIWSRQPAQRVGADRWRVNAYAAAEQLVIEYDDELFVPVVIYPGFVTVAAHDDHRSNGWLLRSLDEWVLDDHQAIEIMARMQSGDLPPSEVDQVAAGMRAFKHANPVIGAICAYLYDYVGDLDSIRRMAFFYKDHNQAIPYDISLMGQLGVRYRNHRFKADIPAVEQRLNGGTGVPDYVTQATEATQAPVGGLCPWLRQGWDFIEAPADPQVPIAQRLPDVRKYLQPTTFTSFNREGGKILTKHWGLERWQ